jgi:ribonuclease Z
MTIPFELEFVNGLSGDPAVYLFNPRAAESLLFDLGSLDGFSHRKLLKVRNVFVSHTHVDHFIGFDRLLRVNIPHRREVRLFGPKGFVDQVYHKIKGYTWNLLDPGQITFEVVEIDKEFLTRAKLVNDNGFEPTRVKEKITSAPDEPILIYHEVAGVHIYASILDHGTPSIAYKYMLPPRTQVDAERIKQDGLSEGAWIREVQLCEATGENRPISIGGQQYLTRDLADKYLIPLESVAVGYLTDIAFSKENVAKLYKLFAGLSMLIGETSFLDDDRSRAFEKKHLTTKMTSLIAAAVGAKDFKPFHFSNIYKGLNENEEEAQKFFATFKQLDQAAIVKLLDEELVEP